VFLAIAQSRITFVVSGDEKLVIEVGETGEAASSKKVDRQVSRSEEKSDCKGLKCVNGGRGMKPAWLGKSNAK